MAWTRVLGGVLLAFLVAAGAVAGPEGESWAEVQKAHRRAFKKLGLPRRLYLVVEGESLFNDGAAVVMFSLILAALTGSDVHGAAVREVGAVWVAAEFIKEVFGGLAAGLVAGLAFSYLTSRVDDHLIEIMLTTILAYGTYILAEHLHVSGVIGVVAAGMMSGNYGSRVGMSPTTKVAVTSFWEYAAFVVNSIIFLLIGMEVNLSRLFEYRWHILAAKHGNPGAQYNLAFSYWTGRGIVRSAANTFIWASLSVHCSPLRNRTGEVLRDQAAAELDPKQIAAADQLINQRELDLPHPWSEHMRYWQLLAGQAGVFKPSGNPEDQR